MTPPEGPADLRPGEPKPRRSGPSADETSGKYNALSPAAAFDDAEFTTLLGNFILRQVESPQFARALSTQLTPLAERVQALDSNVLSNFKKLIGRFEALEAAIARIPGGTVTSVRGEPDLEHPEDGGWGVLQWDQSNAPVSKGNEVTPGSIKIEGLGRRNTGQVDPKDQT